MSDNRGVFLLLDAIDYNLSNEWVDLNEVWINPKAPNTGYFGGGATPPITAVSTVDKVSYSSDTAIAIPSASFTRNHRFSAATGNINGGYFAGDLPGRTWVDKVTYSSDTTVAVPGANLISGRYNLAATGNSTAGYFGGGTPGPLSSMDKVTYSSDTTISSPKSNLVTNAYGLAATGNSTAGYFGGGTPGPLSSMDKVTYSSDTTSTVPGAALSVARFALAATGNSTAGYFGGGRTPSVNVNYSTVDKLTYSTDTTAAVPGAALSAARSYFAATGNSTSGYFGGGSPGPLSTTDKVTYSTDTTAAVPGAALSASRYALAATGALANALPTVDTLQSIRFFDSKIISSNTGYFGGGERNVTPTALYTTMDRLNFTYDTTEAVPSANLITARANASLSSGVAGYFSGGKANFSIPLTFFSTTEKVTYSSDTTARAPGALLTEAKRFVTATGNSAVGYFDGGESATSYTTTVEKIYFSNDTISYFVSGGRINGTFAHGSSSSTSSSTAGYFAGGYFSPGGIYYSSVDKLTYSNEIRSTVPGAALSIARGFFAATGSSTAGYFGGGSPGPLSTMEKITYSTDTTTTVPGAALSASRYDLAATGNSTAGYFGGGGGGNSRSTMDKVTYSTDTTSVVPGAVLSVPRDSVGASSGKAIVFPLSQLPISTPTSTIAVSVSNVGYFGGGGSSGSLSTMDKVTYSSDTTAAVPGAALSVGRSNLAATGNLTSGYFGGGLNPSNSSVFSTVDRVTYSSDTTAAVPGAVLSNVRYGLSASGNSTAGYFGGGSTGAPVFSTMDKVTYSSNTTSTVPGAALSVARFGLAATGSSTAGYFGGGSPGPLTSMDKITYSTDTTAAVPGAALSRVRFNIGATGNSTAGYFGGGRTPSVNYSTVDKLTYSSDTTAAVPGAALSVARYDLAATGNSTAGYFGGGSTGAPVFSTMDKVTYSSDTTAAVPGAALSVARFGPAASSPTANGLSSSYVV
jgi:hypothetical protein